MRGYAILLGAVLTVVGCAGPEPDAPPADDTPAAADPVVVDPDAVARVRSALPPGYEVGTLADHAAPAAFWGMKPDWTATPAQCGALADPGPGVPVRGWSASGPGGIIYAMVAGPQAPAGLPAGCEQIGRAHV